MKTKICASTKTVGYITLRVLQGIALILALILVGVICILLTPLAIFLSPLAPIVPIMTRKTNDRFVVILSYTLIPLFIISDITGIFTNVGTVTKGAIHTYAHYAIDVSSIDVVFIFVSVIFSIILLFCPSMKEDIVNKYARYLEDCKK